MLADKLKVVIILWYYDLAHKQQVTQRGIFISKLQKTMVILLYDGPIYIFRTRLLHAAQIKAKTLKHSHILHIEQGSCPGRIVRTQKKIQYFISFTEQLPVEEVLIKYV